MTLINDKNTDLVNSLVAMLSELEKTPEHNAIVYDMYISLRTLVLRYGEDYPRCSTCRMPASGISRDCAECRHRHPVQYRKTFEQSKRQSSLYENNS